VNIRRAAHSALPLLAAFSVFLGDLPPLPTITRYVYAGDVQNVQTTMIRRIYGRSYAIGAELNVPDGGAEGVIVAFADFIGGFALWVDENGLLTHTYQFLGVDTYRQTATEPIPAGDITVKMLFESEQPTPGSGGRVTLWAGDKPIGEGTLPQTVTLVFTTYAGIDIGRDNGGVVDFDYEDEAPYAFTGTVKRVVFDLQPATAHEYEQALHAAIQQAGVARGVAG
jgi:arylsulfatase